MNIFTLIKPIKSVDFKELNLETLNYLSDNKEIDYVVLKIPKSIRSSAEKLLNYYNLTDLDTESDDDSYDKLLSSNMISRKVSLNNSTRILMETIVKSKLNNIDSLNLLLGSIGIKVNCITEFKKVINSTQSLLAEYHIYPTRTSLKYKFEDYVQCGRDEYYALKSMKLAIESKGKFYRHKELYKFK